MDSGTNIPSYEVRISARAKRLSVTVQRDGRVAVTRPRRMPESLVAPFVARHAEWIRPKAHEHPPGLLAHLDRRDYARHKEQARKVVAGLLERYLSAYGLEAGTVRIGAQTSRWGSCSARGNLNFNFKIAFLPKPLQEYVVAHEVCHLREMNHSERFWRLVAQEIPNWRELRRELRAY